MNPDVLARLLAAESAPLRPDVRLITTMSLTFENFLDEMGCPLTAEQSAVLERMRSDVAA